MIVCKMSVMVMLPWKRLLEHVVFRVGEGKQACELTSDEDAHYVLYA